MPFLAVSIYVRACRSRCLVPFRRAGYRLSCLLLKIAEAEGRGSSGEGSGIMESSEVGPANMRKRCVLK